MAKKQYQSPMAKWSRFEEEDVITGSGDFVFADGEVGTYGAFDESWLTTTNK